MKKLFQFFLFVTAGCFSAIAENYYVSPAGSNDNMGTESAPFATLEHAVSVAAGGDSIFLADGTYTRTSTDYLVIDKAIEVRGINGKENVAIVGNGTGNRSGLKITAEGAVLRGVTLRSYKSSVSTIGTAAALEINAGLVEDCAISNNTANVGSGVKITGGVLRDSIVANNKAGTGGNDRRGGGVFVSGGVVEGCEIFANQATVGAGVSVEGAGAVVRNCRVFDNSARDVTIYLGVSGLRNEGYGGGVYIANGLVEGCVITGNTAPSSGGVRLHGGTIQNCLVANNKTLLYGCQGIYLNNANARAYNCTIAGLSACGYDGTGLYIESGVAKNMVVISEENAIPNDQTVYVSASGTLATSCIAEDLSSFGEGMIKSNPAYFDTDYRPLVASLQGGEDLTELFTTDLEGNVRLAADFGMGAYLYAGAPSDARIIASSLFGKAPLEVSFGSIGASAQGWDFGDGATSADAEPTHTFANPGRYSVTMTTAGGTSTLEVTVASTETFVSLTGSDTFPYDTPEKATPRIKDAYEAVWADGENQGVVHIANGTYTDPTINESKTFSSYMLYVDKNVKLLGESKEKTIIDGRGKHQIILMRNPNAILENLTLTGGRFDLNNWGSAANLLVFDGLVRNCIIRNGFGNYNGNVSIYGGLITDCVVSNGTLNVSGEDRPAGGINAFRTARVENCDLCYNKGGYGAGLYIGDSSTAVASNCRIYGNYGATRGGGGATLRSGTLENSIIRDNIAPGGGGGVYLQNANATLRNCVVFGNVSQGLNGYGSVNGGGGGIYLHNGKVQNCTVSQNSAMSPSGNGIYQAGGTVVNTISWGNGGMATDYEKVGGTCTYSCAPVAISGDGNVVANPLFAAPLDGDFSLGVGSGAIDMGTAIDGITTDIVGTVRPCGDAFDMGAYEMDLSAVFACSFSADVATGKDSLTATLSANVIGGTGTYVKYLWDFNDGEAPVETTVPSVIHTFGLGSATVKLTVIDSEGREAEYTMAGVVNVSPSVTYASPAGQNIYPYESWEKAANFLQDAIDAVHASGEEPGTVLVADGKYQTKDTDSLFSVSLTRPVRLVGTNENCKAVINATFGKESRRAMIVNHPQAYVANLIISNGYYLVYQAGQAGGLWLYDGVVTNCIIAKNRGMCAGGVTQYGGLLTHSIIRNNDGGTHNGGDRVGGGVSIWGGTVEHCTIEGNIAGRAGAAYLNGNSAVMRDCILQGNFSTFHGNVLIEKGLVERCIIEKNGQGQKTTSSTDSTGAGVYISGANSILRSSIVADNVHTNAGNVGYGIYVANGAKVINVTAVKNTTDYSAKNQDIENNGGLVANSIVTTILKTSGTNDANFEGGDPLFRDFAGGNYMLRRTSPCVNKGKNSYWEDVDGALDVYGNPRIKMYTVDQGAIETMPSKATVFQVR